MFVCVCNRLTDKCIKEACNTASEPIEVFEQCGKSPRCCTCFPLIQKHINYSPSKIQSIDDLPDYMVENLKRLVIPSLPHIWRHEVQNGQILFYKNQERIMIGVSDNQVEIKSDTTYCDYNVIVDWFYTYTSILKGDINEE